MENVLFFVLYQGAEGRMHDGLGEPRRARGVQHVEWVRRRELFEPQRLIGGPIVAVLVGFVNISREASTLGLPA